MSLVNIPYELLQLIVSFVPLPQHRSVACVCQRLHRACKDRIAQVSIKGTFVCARIDEWNSQPGFYIWSRPWHHKLAKRPLHYELIRVEVLLPEALLDLLWTARCWPDKILPSSQSKEQKQEVINKYLQPFRSKFDCEEFEEERIEFYFAWVIIEKQAIDNCHAHKRLYRYLEEKGLIFRSRKMRRLRFRVRY